MVGLLEKDSDALTVGVGGGVIVIDTVGVGGSTKGI